jgi:ferrous iron transport protein A
MTTLPLSMASVGQALCLKHIGAGRKLTHRLMELGLTPGVKFTIVQDSGGPLLLSVRDSRVALGRGMAHKLMVEPCANGENGHK